MHREQVSRLKQEDSFMKHSLLGIAKKKNEFFAKQFRTGGFSIEKTYKGHSPEPPTLVVEWMEQQLLNTEY